jgi:hypothetical protein
MAFPIVHLKRYETVALFQSPETLLNRVYPRQLSIDGNAVFLTVQDLNRFPALRHHPGRFVPLHEPENRKQEANRPGMFRPDKQGRTSP